MKHPLLGPLAGLASGILLGRFVPLAPRATSSTRMDALLEKVQREGLQALTDEERRFLTRVSARYRNRH